MTKPDNQTLEINKGWGEESEVCRKAGLLFLRL
jgi:hypothetical protein